MPLRLKTLELQGYKTFASKTTFEFAGGITAIVGPNGSGKSNVADALRWVLGEQSYTLLRGKKTEDMIFNGSEHRPRASMASVHILFDNSDGWLPIDFTEASITRRAYRDGHNDYLLNAQQVRLRDLNELLAASGMSERTYTIIGQGLVDASLALKADERRRLFEEAAGVGLYRVRREEAIKRLENAQHNLERVLDIMSELEPRLRSLERQAKRAIEFTRAQADLKVILRDWYGYHWHLAQQELAGAREMVKAQELRVHEAREVHQRAQAQYTSFRERLSDLRGRLNTWHRQAAELHSQREEVSRALAVLDERRRSLISAQSTALTENERSSDEEKVAGDRFVEAEREIDRLQSEYDEARRQQSEFEQTLESRQAARSGLEDELQGARSQLEKWNAQRAESQARLEELTQRVATLEARIKSAEEQITGAEAVMREAESRLAEARRRREEAQEALNEAETAQGKRRTTLEELENERRTKSDSRAERLSEHARLKTRLEVLEQAEESLAGFAEGARFLLDAARQARLGGSHGALSAALDVPAELETAVSAALGDTLDAIVLDASGIDDALNLLESGEAGRAVLLPLQNGSLVALSRPNGEDLIGVASELVRAPENLRAAVHLILGQTLIVRGRAEARRLIGQLPPHARVVTLRGEVFRGDGVIVAGKTAASSALSRPRQKRELGEGLVNLSREIDSLNQDIEQLSAQITAAQNELGQAERSARAARVRLDEAQGEERQASIELESAERQLEWQKSQREQLNAEAAEVTSNRESLIRSQESIASGSERVLLDIKTLSAKLQETELAEAQGQAAYWNTRVAVVERALADARSALEERRADTERFTSRRSELAARLQEIDSALAGLEQEKSALHERETVLHSRLGELGDSIDPAEKDLETAEQEEGRLQEAEAAAQRTLASAERLHGQVQLELVRKQEGLEHLRQRVVDDFGLVMFDYAADVAGPVPLPLEGMVEELPVITEISPDLESQLTQQRTRLRRAGPINPEAKQEFDKESERYSFMRAQVDDLRKAEEDLRQVIAELDEMTRQQFSKTFDAVDRQFRAMFTRLFGGGSARLALTDPDDLVETGIEIEARLPGRREQGLALLSGGERSLTAVALVFALLKVSPTPVCVMDEVDAMLDEANVGRFRDLLLELSQETQFIIITHNRNTVQAADVIYGITMGRDSASQVISLRLDQVTDEMLKLA